jgi:iron(III) transport system substrate-binding protein
MYAELNGEYPVNPKAESSDFLKSLGTFKAADTSLDKIAKARKAALQMINEVDYNS